MEDHVLESSDSGKDLEISVNKLVCLSSKQTVSNGTFVILGYIGRRVEIGNWLTPVYDIDETNI